MSPIRFLVVLFALAPAAKAIEPPHAIDPGLTVELVAMEPDIRTPTAVAVDRRGRIWVLENNTHFRPKIYDAPPTDRVVILDDFSPDGRARKFTVFADNFKNGMGLLLLGDGDAVVSTRNETVRVRDTDGDDRADARTTLLRLETTDDYPHNGLSGVALGLDEAGKNSALFIGIGENHGAPWTLTGSDGKVVRGSDEGGIFRLDPEGKNLERWATGLWNPFGLAVAGGDEVYALDNDPGGGSNCRLLKIVRGGEYGYRYRYGRAIDHPFVSWFGQLPGTIPPLCLVGEAPTGLIRFHPPGLRHVPGTLRWDLLGCTWSEHGIQNFPTPPDAHAVARKPEWMVRGGNDFRPTGLAEAPDGSLVFGDWVDGAYEVHGKGRVWRLKPTPENEEKKSGLAIVDAQTEAAAWGAKNWYAPEAARTPLQKTTAQDALADLGTWRRDIEMASAQEKPFAVHRSIEALARSQDANRLRQASTDSDPLLRVIGLLAFRRSGLGEGRELLPKWLGDPDGAVRRAALQWIGEEQLTDLQPQLEKAIAGQPSRTTFQAYVAALQMIATGKPNLKAGEPEIQKIALDSERPPELRALALRLLPAEETAFPLEKLRTVLTAKDRSVQLEAVRILALRANPPAQAELRRIASDAAADNTLRAEALAGLALAAEEPETQKVLHAAAESGTPELAREAARGLGSAPAASQPAAAAEILQVTGDANAGRRLFYHPNGPRCFTCHAIENRGGKIGPDLTTTGGMTAEQLLEAIREPSKDIAPAYVNWQVKLRDGREFYGIDLFEDNKSQITLVDAAGARTKIKVADIVLREALPISLMPPGLTDRLPAQDLGDLLAFLRQARD